MVFTGNLDNSFYLHTALFVDLEHLLLSKVFQICFVFIFFMSV